MPKENNNQDERVKKVEDFLLDPEKVIFESLEDFKGAVQTLVEALAGVDLSALETLKGVDGITPKRGVDYMNEADIAALQAFLLDNIPVVGVDLPSREQVEAYIKAQVAKIPRVKGEPGKDGKRGEKGKDGSPDSAADIVAKIRTLRGKNQMLQTGDIRGLDAKIRIYDETVDEVASIKKTLDTIYIPTGAPGGGEDIAAVWGSITGTLSAQTDLQNALNAKQATLVSGTNIKTINGTSLLGSGDITVGGSTTLAGVSLVSNDATKSLYTMASGVPVEFKRSGGSSLLYLDETNGRIGIGTASPAQALQIGSTADRILYFDTTLGVMSLGQTGNTVAKFSINPSINDATIQFALNVLPTWSVSGLESTGIRVAQSVANGVTKANGAGLVVEGVTANPGGGAGIEQYASGVFRGTHGSNATFAQFAYTLMLESSQNGTIWLNSDSNTTTNTKGIIWGVSKDTTLFRSAASELATDAAFKVGAAADNNNAANGIYFGLSKDTMLYRQAANRLATAGMFVVGHATDGTTSANALFFGASLDTNLYRSAAGQLTTDGKLRVSTSLGIVGAPNATAALMIGASAGIPSSGGISRVIYNTSQIPATTTTAAYGFVSEPSTAASAFTLTNYYGINLTGISIGAGSTVTNQYGLYLGPMTTATNNYGIAVGKASTATLWLSNVSDDTTKEGGISFGLSRDTNIYRSAADTLKTDDSLIVVGSLGATGTRVVKGWFTDLESTNMPTVGGTAILTSLTAPTFNTIEIGTGQTDTTLSRLGAGDLGIEGVSVLTTTNTKTLTNKRITKRVQSVADAATITPDADANDAVDITAIAQAFTIANPTGTPTNFQQMIIRIKDNGTARAITWGSNYVAGGVALPSTTVLSKILNLGFQYNTANALNKWQLIAASQEA